LQWHSPRGSCRSLSPGYHGHDEVFQTLEQAHRLVFGNGLVPWEFVYGAISSVLPGALATLMVPASLLGGGAGTICP
jgi:GPI mannosyltransferase 3